MLLISAKYKRIIHTSKNPRKYHVLFLWRDYPETQCIQRTGAYVNHSSTHKNEVRKLTHAYLKYTDL